MSPHARAQFQIHICVVLWGFTAILGKLISLPALSLVWWRMWIVVAALALWPRVWRGLAAMPVRLIAIYAGIGAVVSLHWLTFYAAIKLSNASVGVTCIALAPVLLALIEPWVARRRFDAREVLLGIAVVPGVALLVGGVTADMRLGVLVGALSALLDAMFGALNKRHVMQADAVVVTAIELAGGALFLTLLAPLAPGPSFIVPDARDFGLLLVLALGCTLLPFTLSLMALRQLSAFSAQLAVNLEPLYAIVLAMLLFGEHHELGLAFYGGLAIVLGAVFAHPLMIWRPRRRQASAKFTADS